MAPGCSNVNAASSFSDTIDSFEVLEQTVMKQKRLAKKKKCDLRLRILLKRTFDLVCEIMDRENGFDDDYLLLDTTCTSSSTDTNITSSTCSSDGVTAEMPAELESIPLPPCEPPCPPPPPPSDENVASKEVCTDAEPLPSSMITDDQQVPQEVQQAKVLSSISENSFEKVSSSAKKRKISEPSTNKISSPKRIKSVDINIHIKRGILVQAM